MDTSLGNKSHIYLSGYGYSKRRCESVANWFLNTFLPKHKIGVNFHHKSLVKENVVGYCDWIGTSYKPRDFEIQLQSNMDAECYIETVLHELVHLRQWVKGTLTMKSGKFIWKGENVDHIEYMNQPHEVEPFREEGILYRRYMKEVKGVTVQEPTQYFPNRLTQPI